MNKKPIVLLLAAALSPMASAVLAAEDTVDIPRLVVTSDPLGNRTSDELIQPVTVIAGDELNKKRSSRSRLLRVMNLIKNAPVQ